MKKLMHVTRTDIKDIIYLVKNELSFEPDYEITADDLEELDL